MGSRADLQDNILSLKSTVDFGVNEFSVKILDCCDEIQEKKWRIHHKQPQKRYEIFRGDFRRSGKYDSKDVDSKPLSITKYKGVYRCTPTVVDDVVYYGNKTSFRAVQFEQGKVIWEVPLLRKNDYNYTVTWYEGLLFVSVDNSLHCLDAQSGKTKWVYTVKGEPVDGPPYIVRFPVAVNGIVFFSCDKYFHALDIDSCKLLWLKKYSKIKTLATVCVKRNIVYFGEGDSQTTLHGLDMLSGKEVESFSLPKIWWSSPALQGDKIYIASFEGSVFVIDTTLQSVKRKKLHLNERELAKLYPVREWFLLRGKRIRLNARLAIDDSIQYMSVSTHGLLQAFDLNNKDAPLWTYRLVKESLSKKREYVMTSPIITDNNIYVAALKCIYALKKQGDKEPKLLWKLQTEGNLCEPVIKDGTLFCASTDGNLYVLK
ncbi:outer membrane protein assembly factor BamB [Candidatus Uabimicrobium amorphum]|uniref:Outer membrane protein assembly factor BamB n=2 Tax=Uabimicrobium amorphum TaxID=2596890 RepID=A0A5S9IP38_UABAM|nr:PQQ-binding-like beta-propeller repeat protein [Candidatus Uabimicrobium amorphum]BBM85493.1 outer membrane protein assembly factor BamB [Candidatus Uabimicrobium amorphum]